MVLLWVLVALLYSESFNSAIFESVWVSEFDYLPTYVINVCSSITDSGSKDGNENQLLNYHM